MKYTLSNIVTLSRAVLALLFFLLFQSKDSLWVIISVIVFIIAAITDYFDGWFARRYQETSDWGRVADPLADKVLTTAAFVAFAIEHLIPWWMVAIVVIRDIATTYLRSFADRVHKPMHTSFSAKSKTFVQMTFIITVLVALAVSYLPWQPQILNNLSFFIVHPTSLFIGMLFVALFTAWTGIEYSLSNRHVTALLWKTMLTTLRGNMPESQQASGNSQLFSSITIAVTTLGGAGFFPVAPGTAGSLVALLIFFIPTTNLVGLLLTASAIAIILGLVFIPTAEQILGNDAASIVLDEALGIWLTLASPIVPLTPLWVLIGFILFRLFDIWKPFPIRLLNKRRGAVFVLLDDVVAAIFAFITYHILYFVMQSSQSS